MNNAIKYVLCAGASLAIGFGGGYCFKHEQDKIAFQKQAEYNEQAMRYASEGFSKISSDLYSAEQSAARISEGIEESRKATDAMIVDGLKGTSDSPDIGGFNDLFKDKKEEEKKYEDKKDEEKNDEEKK